MYFQTALSSFWECLEKDYSVESVLCADLDLDEPFLNLYRCHFEQAHPKQWCRAKSEIACAANLAASLLMRSWYMALCGKSLLFAEVSLHILYVLLWVGSSLHEVHHLHRGKLEVLGLEVLGSPSMILISFCMGLLWSQHGEKASTIAQCLSAYIPMALMIPLSWTLQHSLLGNQALEPHMNTNQQKKVVLRAIHFIPKTVWPVRLA